MATALMSLVLLGASGSERHRAQITFRVITDAGQPVPGIDLTVSNFLRWKAGEGFGEDVYERIKVRTDGKGLAVFETPSARQYLGYSVSGVPGYYSTHETRYWFKEVQNGRWQPWNPQVDVVLKPVLRPIPMYARVMGRLPALLELPVRGTPVGFDLEKGEWVAPWGGGVNADLVFAVKEIVPRENVRDAFEYRLELTFSNEGDGIQAYPINLELHEGSELRMPRHAPERGYAPRLEKQLGRPARGEPLYPAQDEKQNYFFRVRTVLDEKGEVKSALYGKIMGDIGCDVINSRAGYLQFTYYLNPTPLDRNMEFDPKRNLAGNVPSFLRVTQP